MFVPVAIEMNAEVGFLRLLSHQVDEDNRWEIQEQSILIASLGQHMNSVRILGRTHLVSAQHDHCD